MSNKLMNNAIKKSQNLEFKIQKIIKDFEFKTKTIILLSVKENELKLGIAIDIDKSTI